VVVGEYLDTLLAIPAEDSSKHPRNKELSISSFPETNHPIKSSSGLF